MGYAKLNLVLQFFQVKYLVFYPGSFQLDPPSQIKQSLNEYDNCRSREKA